MSYLKKNDNNDCNNKDTDEIGKSDGTKSLRVRRRGRERNPAHVVLAVSP